MIFKNTTGELKILRRDGNIFYDVKPGEVIDLPELVGHHYGFSVVAGKPEPVEVVKPPEKKIDEKMWENELLKIPKIKKETVSDIIVVYPNKASLVEAINKGVKLPFRNDIEKMLKKVFMK